MLNIRNFNENKNVLEKSGAEIHVDSIKIESAGRIDEHFFKDPILHEIKSCAKVLVAMAIGIAIDQKATIDGVPLTLDTHVWPVLKSIAKVTYPQNERKIEKWTIKNLLMHATGYAEQILSERFIKNVDKSKLVDYALNYDLPYEVGTRYAYNNVEPYILSVFFQEAFKTNISDYINEHIFQKLGIKEYKWLNYGKYCVGSSGLYLYHQDFHKIGQLLLRNGLYGDIQVVPSAWILEMCLEKISTEAEYKPERVLPKIKAGYFTFISRNGYIFRDGGNGQYLILNKQNNTLISILSSEPDMKRVTEIMRGLI